MTEIPIQTNTIGTISYSRKKGLPNYSSEDGFFAIQFAIENDDDAKAIVTKANEAFALAKATVNAELGLPIEDAQAAALIQTAFGPETQIEVLAEVTPIRTQEPAVVADMTASADAGVGPNPPYGGDYKDWTKSQKEANTAWAKARLASHPDEFYDNREDKKNPKAPDFKHKSSGIGIWAD